MKLNLKFGATAIAQAIALLALAGCGGGTAEVNDAEEVAESFADGTSEISAVTGSAVQWRSLVGENQKFTVPANSRVRFGRSDLGWVEKTISGPGSCTNAFFGFDPKRVGFRFCQIAGSSGATKSVWRLLAGENSGFSVPANSRVRYGRSDLGWVEKTLSGPGKCSNSFFGFDPKPDGFRECYVAVAPAPGPAPAPAPAPPAPAPTGAPTALSASCAALYPSNFALNSGRSIDAVPAMAKPVKGVEYVEPSYKTCMVRATDHAAERIDGFVRNDYSRRQAFNANSSKYVAYALNGSWRLYDSLTNAHLKALPGPAGDAEIQWHATNPDLLYYIPANGVGMQLYELNVATGVSRVVGDFGARLRAKWPSASAAWTKSEGSPSKDGRYWCFMVDSVDANGQWSGLGLFTWDRDTDKIVGMVDHPGGVRPDHLSMSPSGNYCVWSGNTVQAFTRDLKQRSTVVAQGEHSDLALDANGDDVFVSVDYQTNSGELYMVNLRTKQRTSLLPTYIAGTATALHISGKAFNKPGWMLLSTYSDYGDAGRQWMHRKVMAVQLKASPKVYNLAFTRAAPNGYWAEPHATVNRDFTRVMFNSNWGSASDSNLDAYIVQLPVGALK